MNTFTWTPEYSVGVQIIDEQHQHFFAIANKLFELAHAGTPSRDAVTALFGELGDYALYHLSTEESFFRELKYEDAQAHIAAHDEYRARVAGHFSDALSAPDANLAAVAEEMATYSSAWLQNHIMVMDKQYTAFFNRHGFT